MRAAGLLMGMLLTGGLLSGCDRATPYMTLEGATMGTYYRVTARCPGRTTAGVRALLEAELEQVNAEMSTYRADSELSRFNDSAPGGWFPVSAELATVIRAAAEISERSAGAFDVTVAPLVNLWGFGPAGEITEAPDQSSIRAALSRVGYRHLQVATEPPALSKDRPLIVDLSAIAKGHGVDRLGGRLAAFDCSDYLVDVGGEVLGVGSSPSGRAWRVGVEVPDAQRIGSVQRVLTLSGAAVATSGDYRNFLELDIGRVSHTLDPRTGRPVAHDLASVTVVHHSAMLADALATALNVLGPEAGFAQAEREGLAALFIIRRASGFEERYTGAILKQLDDAQ